MPFRGLTMLKSRKLVIKGGLCYRFAMVHEYNKITKINNAPVCGSAVNVSLFLHLSQLVTLDQK